jgi:peptide/nickel transport system permease protein
MFGGTVIIETIFMWPGIGRLLVESVYARDFSVIQGCVLVIALIYVFINLVVDVSYAFIDPRIRYGSKDGT